MPLSCRFSEAHCPTTWATRRRRQNRRPQHRRLRPRRPTPTPIGTLTNGYFSGDYQANGVLSYTTTATGLDTFAAAGRDGGSLSLTEGDEEYTVDELHTNTNEIDTSESGSGTADASLDASSSDDSAYSLSMEVAGSLSEAGTDRVISSEAEIDYSGNGSGAWDYSGSGNGGTTEGGGEETDGYDLDVYGL